MKYSGKEMQKPEVLFADRHLLVLEKPNGLLTQMTEQEKDCALSFAKEWIDEQPDLPRSSYLTPVFRLDRAVSGFLLFARSSKAASRLQGEKKHYFMSKCYLALIEGKLEEKEGVFEDWLIHGDYRAEPGTQTNGKFAALIYRVLEEREETSLVEIELLTGRYHQIRYQFASRMHPIVGDHKYGSKKNFRKDAIALHHFKLAFIHPVSEEMLLFQNQAPFELL